MVQFCLELNDQFRESAGGHRFREVALSCLVRTRNLELRCCLENAQRHFWTLDLLLHIV